MSFSSGTAEAALRSFLTSELGLPAAQIERDTPLLESGLIDSLGVIALIAFCEEELDCLVPPEDISPDTFRSLGTLLEGISRWRQG